jgi:hypothetical protein
VINEGNLPVLARKGVGLHVDARLGRRGGELARRLARRIGEEEEVHARLGTVLRCSTI